MRVEIGNYRHAVSRTEILAKGAKIILPKVVSWGKEVVQQRFTLHENKNKQKSIQKDFPDSVNSGEASPIFMNDKAYVH